MGMSVSCSGGKVSLRHDQREYKKGQYPKNIDESRSILNESFVRCETTIEQAFNDFFRDSLGKYNEKQTRADRKKTNYWEEIKHSKNKETPVYEYVIQIGNKDNVQGTDKEKDVVECLREYARDFQKNNPQFHVVSMQLHRDEATPHLHISFIPFSEGYKTGLEKRCSTSQALDKMGFKGQERNMKSWKAKQEDYIEELMNLKGLERERLGSTRGRVDVELYKEIKEKALEDAKEVIERAYNDERSSLKSSEAFRESVAAEIREEITPGIKKAVKDEIRALEDGSSETYKQVIRAGIDTPDIEKHVKRLEDGRLALSVENPEPQWLAIDYHTDPVHTSPLTVDDFPNDIKMPFIQRIFREIKNRVSRFANNVLAKAHADVETLQENALRDNEINAFLNAKLNLVPEFEVQEKKKAIEGFVLENPVLKEQGVSADISLEELERVDERLKEKYIEDYMQHPSEYRRLHRYEHDDAYWRNDAAKGYYTSETHNAIYRLESMVKDYLQIKEHPHTLQEVMDELKHAGTRDKRKSL